MTLPRYIHVTRPGSRQQVIELEREVVDLVRSELPLPRGASIRIRYGDARAVLERLPAGLFGMVELVVVDIFSGAHTPAHVTSLEFYREAAKLLAPNGVMAVNIADGPGLRFARSQVATLAMALVDVAVLAETQVIKGRRFGNFVIIGSKGTLPLDWMPRPLAGGPHPSKVVAGAELKDWIAGAPITTDATAIPSPPPSKSIFQVRPKQEFR
jgi:spermidine synthase